LSFVERPDSQGREAPTLAGIRWLILALLTFGMIGTAADLLLLDHYEDLWQVPPLVLIAAGLAAAAATAARPTGASVTALRWLMVLFIVSGLAGLLLHFNGNREFQREMDPSLSGWPLIVKVVTAKAPPALAPAAMIQLGLLGLIFAYRHPARKGNAGVGL
jgi:hypothetical protein